jgi:hypothetical protein
MSACDKSVSPTPFFALTLRKKMKRILVAIAGATVLAAGIALIVLPGPAIIVIPAGLAILAIEFAWAKRWLHNFRNVAERGRAGIMRWFGRQGAHKKGRPNRLTLNSA